jgi:hypothetical protein
MTTERWLPVDGNPAYEVSDLGRVRHSGRHIRGSICGGYRLVQLGRCGPRRAIHLLVLETFVGPAPQGHEAAHQDGDAENNALTNLRWMTHLDNMRQKHEHGTVVRGEAVNTAKLTEVNVLEIRRLRSLGWSYPRLARHFSVSIDTAWKAANRFSWKHVA